jgi:hypothetical protein
MIERLRPLSASGAPAVVNSPMYILDPADTGRDHQYGEFRGPVTVEQLPRWLGPGSVVAVRPHPHSAWNDLAGSITAAHRRLVNAPLALWPDCIDHDRALEFSGRARQLGVRCNVWKATPSRERIRKQLADPVDWPRMGVLWLLNRRSDLPSGAMDVIEHLAENAMRFRDVSGLAARDTSVIRGWNRLFRSERMGSVGRWYSVLRVTRISLEIQRSPDSIESIALGVADYSALAALGGRLARSVGASPMYIRKHLGWQWIIARAIERSGIDLLTAGQKCPVIG